jgi:hypothetical protein
MWAGEASLLPAMAFFHGEPLHRAAWRNQSKYLFGLILANRLCVSMQKTSSRELAIFYCTV